MGLFNFKKKKDDVVSQIDPTKCSGCSGCSVESCGDRESTSDTILFEGTLSIKVLGSGCAKCNELEETVWRGVQEMGINAEISHVTDFSDIASYGVMSTPALVIGKKVVSVGKVLSKSEVIGKIKENLEV